MTGATRTSTRAPTTELAQAGLAMSPASLLPWRSGVSRQGISGGSGLYCAAQEAASLVTEDLDQVVAAAVLGDAAAMRHIYDSLSPRINGYLRLRGSDDAEGLTNDVFVRVLPRLAELHGGWSGVRAFAFTVAHGLLVDEFRRRGRMPEQESYEAKRDPRVYASSEDEVLAASASGGILDLVELLPDDQKAVVILRVLGGLSIAETAATIGRSEGAVKTLQRDGFDNVRRLAATDGYPRRVTEGEGGECGG